jgi:DNA-binding NarL/FixJ family response regulator
MTADASSSSTVDVSEVWRELVSGSCSIVDSFFSETRCYLMLEHVSSAAATPIVGRRLQIVEAVLASTRQKNIAIELELAPSTVTLHSRLALRDIGINAKPSRPHPLLMLAASSTAPGTRARCSVFADREGRQVRVVGAPRPDELLRGRLPPGERSVVRSLVEGQSHADIASERKTSPRTVANQISAVFRRLCVSGRNELVQSLFTDEYLRLARQGPNSQVPPALQSEPDSAAQSLLRRALRSA